MAKILVVDDELAFREALHHAFSKKGHQVATAISTDHAMNLMASQTFDLIVLDIVMPGESGTVLLKTIRAAQNRVPVVIYSVHVNATLEKEMQQAGANEVLHKSISLEVLVDRTERVLLSAGKSLGSMPGAKKRLLVVDDEKLIRQMLVLFFGKKGYQVLEAASGEEAIESVKTGKPDIVLLDMSMGGMNGLETLKKLLEIHPNLGVIMATAMQDDDMVRQAMERGAYGYVLKPFDFLYLELVVSSKLIIAQTDKSRG